MTLPITGATAAAPVTPAAPAAKADGAAKSGEGFERVLLGQLTKQLVDSALPEDEASSAATNSYRQMLPDALTEALMSGGGIGLAKQLAQSSTGKVAS